MTEITAAWVRAARGRDRLSEPLARVVENVRVVGIAGPPGGGKSTLARDVADRLGLRTLVLSMDDYYLSKRERAERGLAWRGPPGSHDLDALVDVLDRIREGRTPLELQQFSGEIDDRVAAVTLDVVPEHVIVEGWVLGHRSDGYEALLDRLDLLVFLGVPVELARSRRFEREARLRASGGGFSPGQTKRFWDEVLSPGLDRWVRDARDAADLVIELDDSATLASVRTNSQAVRDALR